MSDYYEYGNTLIGGSPARADDVASEFRKIQTGLDLLPTPRVDGNGFAVSFLVPAATQPNQVAQFGQVQELEQLASAHKAAAQIAQIAAEAAAASASTDAGTAQADAATAAAAAMTAQDWASKPYGELVSGSLYSARHYAQVAQEAASGVLKSFQGAWDASGGTLPIESPTGSDVGKFWTISVAGTLPVIGAVGAGWELLIGADETYSAFSVSATAIMSINGSTDPVQTITPAGIGAAPAAHTHLLAQITNAGTAAAKNHGSNVGDVQLVGFLGWGGTASLNKIADLNSTTIPGGFYEANPADTANLPYPATFDVIVMGNGSLCSQILLDRTYKTMMFRTYNGSAWFETEFFSSTVLQEYLSYQVASASPLYLQTGFRSFIPNSGTYKLPVIAGLTNGTSVTVAKAHGHTPTIVVDGASSETIKLADGTTDTSLTFNLDAELTFIKNGLYWEL